MAAGYGHVVASVDSLVRIVSQLVAIRSKLWFYEHGVIPRGVDRLAVDLHMRAKYEIPRDKHHARRLRQKGRATVRYLRLDDFWIILASHGNCVFLAERRFSDIRRKRLILYGYSIAHRNGRASVRIHEEQYRMLVEYFRQNAIGWPVSRLAAEIDGLPFERFAPVRRQLIGLIRTVNRERAAWGLDGISYTDIRLAPRSIPVFERKTTTALHST